MGTRRFDGRVMGNKYPAWIDITAKDATATRTFYAELLGWRLQLIEALNYALTDPNPDTLNPDGNRTGLWQD